MKLHIDNKSQLPDDIVSPLVHKIMNASYWPDIQAVRPSDYYRLLFVEKLKIEAKFNPTNEDVLFVVTDYVVPVIGEMKK